MKGENMKKQLTIALVAHDARKADMVQWALYNADLLSKHKLICTGTTGKLIAEAFEKEEIEADITRKNSGPMGGDAEIAAKVVNKQIDFCVFLIDDMSANPHEADIQMLLRQSRIHNIPIACNRYSADLMITSPLWDEEEYQPTDPLYQEYKRDTV